MTKKKAYLTVDEDLSDIFKEIYRKVAEETPKKITINEALDKVVFQMAATGKRERTLMDYRRQVEHFEKTINVKLIQDITVEHIYDWLASMKVSNQTKLTRLKCLKAFFGKCYDNGWFVNRFWRNVTVKVDSPTKQGACEKDVYELIQHLDLTDFVQLRDATAILTMYQTGLRVGTLSNLEEKHIDLKNKLFRIDGTIMKNREEILLPFDSLLARLLVTLIKKNHDIRMERGVKNELVFITTNGGSCTLTLTNNVIGKRLIKYSKEFGLENINPHALRRGFAMNLRKKGAHISLISKALGHSDIAVTTRYLHIDKEEVAESLRGFL